MRISVIIPVYNNKQRLEKLLLSLTNQTIDRRDYEIIVVDNESSDGSFELAHKFADKVLIQNKLKSPYPSRNMGVKVARGDVKILIDSNVSVENDFLQQGAEQLESHNADIGAPNIIHPLSESSSIWEKLHYVHFQPVDESVANGGLSGICIFTRNNLFERVGYFKEDIRSNGDTIWSNEATKKGAKLVFLDKANVYYPPKNKKQLIGQQIRIGHGNRQAWQSQGQSNLIINMRAIWNMRPIGYRSFKKRYEKKKLNVKLPFFKLWFYISVLRVYRGIGRLGFRSKL